MSIFEQPKRYVNLFLATLFAFTAVGISLQPALAQTIGTWVHDAKVPGYLDDTFPPLLVADQDRTVHAFASQRVDDGSDKAIVYRQWTLEEGWSAPNDIWLSPEGDAVVTGAFVDEDGTMHLAAYGKNGAETGIYYMRAAVRQAGDARAWSMASLVGNAPTTPHSGAFVGDNKGNLMIIYNGTSTGNGVYEVHSTDGGETWSEEIPIFLTYDPKLIPYSLDMSLSASGRLHAVWNVVNSTGVDQTLHYAFCDLSDQQWSESITLDQRIEQKEYFGPSFPKIVSSGELTVVMYNSGNPAMDGPVAAGRPVQRVRISIDGGTTWRDPIQPYSFQLGRSGEQALVVDSNRVVHAIFMQRIENIVDGRVQVIDGPWHGEMRDDRWLEPRNFVSTIAPHDMQAVVLQGNLLLAVWRQDPGVGNDGVWFTYRVLDSPELPVVAIPTVASSTVHASTAPTPALPAPTSTSTPTPRKSTTALSLNAGPAEGSELDSTGTLAIGLAPVVILLLSVVMVRKLSQRRPK